MSARHFDYYSNWKTEVLTCPKCGWTGTFEQGSVEYYQELMDCSCPVCGWPEVPRLAIVSYPTMEETEANLDKLSDEEKESHAERKQFLAELDRTTLRSPDELPDLFSDEIALSWDFEAEQDGKSWTVIKHSSHIVWKERAVYEGSERFVEIVDILKRKYGDRLVDLVPTAASGGYLYGDHLGSGDLVDTARASLRGKEE